MTKNIALFIDGSCNREQIDGETNVHRLYTMTKDLGKAAQICHYISGVGTDRVRSDYADRLRRRARIPDEFRTRPASWAREKLGGLGGFGLTAKIMEAYAFLVEHYDEHAQDRVYLFGFSRGAYAARSLAAFINDVGLLLRNRLYLVPEAYEIYRSGNGRDLLAKYLERRLGHPVALGDAPIPVYLVGAWDTVGSVGVPLRSAPQAFKPSHHRTLELPPNVTHGRHALALHELREKFPPDPLIKSKEEQSLVQVWFAGAHSDVGGGYETSTLSDHSLLWMAGEAAQLGLSVDYGRLRIAPDVTSEVNQELELPHTLFGYECRRALYDLLEQPDSDAAATHWIHPSALQRLAWRTGARAAYRFTPAIADELEQVDRLTRDLALRTASRWATPPAMAFSDLALFDRVEGYTGKFAALLHDIGAGKTGSVRQLDLELMIAHFADEREGVLALGWAFDRCHAELATAALGGPGPRVPAGEWHERTQAGLEAIVAELPAGGAVRSYIETVLAREYLKKTLTQREESAGVVKI
jgi:uncharacterized protein (DUF2235 family)